MLPCAESGKARVRYFLQRAARQQCSFVRPLLYAVEKREKRRKEARGAPLRRRQRAFEKCSGEVPRSEWRAERFSAATAARMMPGSDALASRLLSPASSSERRAWRAARAQERSATRQVVRASASRDEPRVVCLRRAIPGVGSRRGRGCKVGEVAGELRGRVCPSPPLRLCRLLLSGRL